MSTAPVGGLQRRRFLQLTGAGAAAAAFATAADRPASAQPQRGGHLRVAKGHGSTTDTLDPAKWEHAYMAALGYAVHGRLTENKYDGSLVPELAESWEARPGAAEWRFKIRKGVTFHSGKPLTVDDVVASINHHRGEGAVSAAAPLLAPIEDIRTEGDDTVVFILDSGNADFPFILSDYHLPICPAADGGIDWRSGDGCGSYVLKSFKPGVSVGFERNQNHWRDGVAFFDSGELLSIVDQNARTTSLISGDVHAIDKVDLKAAGLMARDRNVTIQTARGGTHYVFAMTTTSDPFTDNNVRQALKYAIDREEMVEKILFGYGSVGNDQPIAPNYRYFNSELEQRSYDPDRARWHIEQAGIDRLSVSIHAADAAFNGAVDAGLLFQNSAKAAGIEIDVIRAPNDGYWSDVWMAQPFVTSAWSSRPTEDVMFSTIYACDASWNESRWCNDHFQSLLVDARAELDEDRRRQMYFEMQALVSNEGGSVIPMFADDVFATRSEVRVGDNLATNWGMDGERWMERWSFA